LTKSVRESFIDATVKPRAIYIMPLVTKIVEPKRRPNRRNIFLDGKLAFSCNVNVVARFRLREGLSLTDEQVQEVLGGQVRQECFDKAMQLLQRRPHSRAELFKKLTRQEYSQALVNGVLDDLSRLGYVDDAQFAKDKALSAARHKHHGPERAAAELLKSGVEDEVARQALGEVYDAAGSTETARQLVRKKAPALRKLDPVVARRRLVGMLQRRGFEYEAIKPIVDEALGTDQ
jgi:regulatory protein